MIKPKCEFICNNALDSLKELPSDYVDCVITSPPYYNLRDYKAKGQIGLEPTYQEYIQKLVEIFQECRRVLKKTGTIWVNLGDTFAGTKVGNDDPKHATKEGINTHSFKKSVKSIPEKSLMKIPERFCIEMIDKGFVNRADIIWYKGNCMPQSATDRFTVDYEHVYMFATQPRGYYFKTLYEPYSAATMMELEEEYNGNGLKDYTDAEVQNPSDTKRNIINSMRKRNGFQRDLIDAFDNAKKLGWDPDKENYADWYFSSREKKSWTDHSDDAEQGFGQQSRMQKPPRIIHPSRIRFGGNKAEGYGRTTYSGKEWYPDFEVGRIKRSVWKINTKPFVEAHFAVYPEELVKSCMEAGCPESGLILDPFMGAATTGLVALKHGRDFIGIDINENYIDIAKKRLKPYIEQTRLI